MGKFGWTALSAVVTYVVAAAALLAFGEGAESRIGAAATWMYSAVPVVFAIRVVPPGIVVAPGLDRLRWLGDITSLAVGLAGAAHIGVALVSDVEWDGLEAVRAIVAVAVVAYMITWARTPDHIALRPWRVDPELEPHDS